jgi:hypothetical protein
MSRTESRAKSFLIPLMQGQACILDSDGQRTLALWLAMKSMVLEFSRPSTVLTPLADRVALMNDHSIPSYYFIRVGRNSSQERTFFFRDSTTISLMPNPTAPDLQGMNRNIHQITISLSGLIVLRRPPQTPPPVAGSNSSTWQWRDG